MARQLNVYGWQIREQLLYGKEATPLATWLQTNEPLPAQARRREGPAPWAVPLLEAVVMGLRGDVLEARTRLADGDGLWLRRRPRRHTRGERIMSFAGSTMAGLRRVDADLGLVALLEAFASRETATDLLNAWEALLVAWQSAEAEVGESLAVPLARVADELWFWLIYRDQTPAPTNDRLHRLAIEVECDARPDPTSDDVAPLLTDPEALTVYRATGLVAPSRLPEALTRRVEGATFCGPQLGQLVLAVERGLHAMLVGPRGTGKSLCATEASRYAHRELRTVEGHEAMQPVDLLGGYVPDRSAAADPFALQAELACRLAVGSDLEAAGPAARYAWADGPLTQAMRQGQVLFVDEANRMPGKTLNVLLGAISRRALVLTEHGSREVRAAAGFMVLMAMNQGQGYLVNPIDAALADRFPVTLEFDYLEPKDEASLLRRRTGLPATVATWMVRVAQETRALRRTRQLPADMTPRGLMAWGELAREPLRGPGDPGRILADAALMSWLPGVAGRDSDGRVADETRDLLLQMVANHRPAGL